MTRGARDADVARQIRSQLERVCRGSMEELANIHRLMTTPTGRIDWALVARAIAVQNHLRDARILLEGCAHVR